MSRICCNCRTPMTSENTYHNTGSVCTKCNTEMVYVGKWKRAGKEKISAQIEKKMREIGLLCKAEMSLDVDVHQNLTLNQMVMSRVAKAWEAI